MTNSSLLQNQDSRPEVPLGVKRILRQSSGFGCCVCGLPIYDYHHIVPYSQDPHFRPQDMMTLCPSHHDMATKGALTIQQQRDAQKNPFNITKGFVTGKLTVNQSSLAIKAGNVRLETIGPVIVVNEEPLLSLSVGSNGNLEVLLRLYDTNGRLLISIEQNEWKVGDIALWDLESSYQRLIIREKSHVISLALVVKEEVTSINGKFWCANQLIHLSPHGITTDGEIVQRVGLSNLGLIGAALRFSSDNKGVMALG